MKDPYDVLGVRRSASLAEIELAYKGRRSQYHPDRYANGDAETIRWATEQMQAVNAAYAVLSDPQQRARFDALRSEGERVAPAAGDKSSPAMSVSLGKLLRQQLAPFHGYERIYFAPAIPQKKLQAALQSYGNGVRGEEILVLADNTFFGGAKEGFMLTEAQLLMKDLMAPACRIGWRDVRRVEVQEKTVYVNGGKYVECPMLEAHELQQLFKVVQTFLDTRGHEQSQPQKADEHRANRQEAAATPSPNKYRNMYNNAKREFLEMCTVLDEMEEEAGEEFVDRDNAVEFFDWLEQSCENSDTETAESAFVLLAEIAILSKCVGQFLKTGQRPPPVAMASRDNEPQLIAELRDLLHLMEQWLTEDRQRQARTREFFGR